MQTPFNTKHGFTITPDDRVTPIDDLADDSNLASAQDLQQEDSADPYDEQWFDV